MSLKLIIKLLVIMIIIAILILLNETLSINLRSTDNQNPNNYITTDQFDPIEKNLMKIRGDNIA